MKAQTVPMQADPEVIDFIVNAARSFIPRSRVILFGSRVKNASQERSDYDIAIEAGTGERSHFDAAYGRFAGLVREKSPTRSKTALDGQALPR